MSTRWRPAKSAPEAFIERLREGSALRDLYGALDDLEGNIRTARQTMSERPRGAGVTRHPGAARQQVLRGAESSMGRLSREIVAPETRQVVMRAKDAKDVVLPRPAPRTVVINCANVGTVYSESRRQLYASQLAPDAGPRKGFDWDGVRRAFRYYESHGLQPQGVCKNRTAVLSPVPADLKPKVIVCPVVDDQRDADDLFTIRLAMRYGCQLVDNDNYRDWKREENRRSSTAAGDLFHPYRPPRRPDRPTRRPDSGAASGPYLRAAKDAFSAPKAEDAKISGLPSSPHSVRHPADEKESPVVILQPRKDRSLFGSGLGRVPKEYMIKFLESAIDFVGAAATATGMSADVPTPPEEATAKATAKAMAAAKNAERLDGVAGRISSWLDVEVSDLVVWDPDPVWALIGCPKRARFGVGLVRLV
eukprot:g33393.t1